MQKKKKQTGKKGVEEIHFSQHNSFLIFSHFKRVEEEGMEDSFTSLLINPLLPQHKLPVIFILFLLLFSSVFLILSTTKSFNGSLGRL